MRNKTAMLMDYICDLKADLYAMTETWLTENDASIRVELVPDGYLTIRPEARKGYGSIAHEAKPNGLLICGP